MLKQLLLAPLLAIALVACAGTQKENQEGADQVFGKGKRLMMYANLTVTTYSAGCAVLLKDSPACQPAYRELASAGAASANKAMVEAEKAYAAANTNDEAGKMAIAQAFLAAVNQLIADLAKYGIDKAAATGPQQASLGDGGSSI